jgi:hypothetical protein
MRRTKDYSRQRLTDFLAARLQARQAETTGKKPEPNDATLTRSLRTEDGPPRVTSDPDASTPQPYPSE